MSDISTRGSLTIRRTDDARGVVLVLEGELDLESAPELGEHLDQVERAHPERLLIDLSVLDFMDSSGLRVLIRARESARDHGYQLVLRRGSRQVQRLLEITGVIDGFTIEP